MAIPRHRTLIHRRVKQVQSVARYTSSFSNHRVHDVLQHRASFFLISGEVPNNGGNRSPIPQTQYHPTVCLGCTDQRTPPSPSAVDSHKCSAASSLLPMRQGVRCIQLFVFASSHPISSSPLGRGTASAAGWVLYDPAHSPARANRVNASVISRTASSTSASVVSKPRLKRIKDSASSLLKPIALRTCDGSGISEVQAEPVDAARCGCRALRMSSAENLANRILALPSAVLNGCFMLPVRGVLVATPGRLFEATCSA